MCETVVQQEMSCICTCTGNSATNQLTELALTTSARWQTSCNGLSITIANIGGKHLVPPSRLRCTAVRWNKMFLYQYWQSEYTDHRQKPAHALIGKANLVSSLVVVELSACRFDRFNTCTQNPFFLGRTNAMFSYQEATTPLELRNELGGFIRHLTEWNTGTSSRTTT